MAGGFGDCAARRDFLQARGAVAGETFGRVRTMRSAEKKLADRFAPALRLWLEWRRLARRTAKEQLRMEMRTESRPAGFGPGQRWVLGLTAAGSFMAALDALVVTTALDTLRHDLAASVESLEWTVNAYSLAFATLLMTGAALGDRFGRKRMYVFGLLLFAAASALCALAPGIDWLIAGRALQGAGAALVMPLAMALLGAAFAPQQRAKALGLFSGITGLAVLSGPLVGGAVLHGLAWQWIFWINVPFALVVAWFVLFQVPESKGSGAALDLPGVILMTCSLLGLVWALVHGNQAGWGSNAVLAALLEGVMVGGLFIGWQRRWDHAMIPPRLFRTPVFAAGLGVCFLMTASLFGTLFFIAQFFQLVHGKSPLAAGLAMLPWTATLFFVAPVAGSMVARVGERALVVIGLALQGAGMVWLSTMTGPGVDYTLWIVPMIVAGAGISMAMPAVQSAVLAEAEPRDIGKAAGLFNTLRQLGGVFGVALAVAVFMRTGGYASARDFGTGFAVALDVCAAFSFAGAALGLRLRGPRKQARTMTSGNFEGAKQ
jgi:EmrB/QacA subfamily drug resistance transporter